MEDRLGLSEPRSRAKVSKRLGFCYEWAKMPTVLRFEGLRVVIYPNDHRPAHVHVIGSRPEAVFDLNCPNGPPDLAALCGSWEQIHGYP